jgi:rhodanese-related sulfurtransferase
MYGAIVGAFVLAALVGVFYSRRQKVRREQQRIRISAQELNQQLESGHQITVVDLRHPLEVLTSPQVIPGAITIAPQELDQRAASISRNEAIVLCCTCPNEETSLKAFQQMQQRGFRRVKVLTGGLPAWKKAQLPLQELYPEAEDERKHAAAQ